MIHYITTNGIGNAWVANELRIVAGAGIPCRLHSMRKPGQYFFDSKWAREMHESCRDLYPPRVGRTAIAALLSPFRFKGRFFSALANAMFGSREHLRARVAGVAHFFVACEWAQRLRHERVDHIHSQWIHSCGTIGMYGALLLGVPFSFTGHAADLFRDRCALRDKIRRATFIICISEFHRQFFLENGARPEQLVITYCGIDPTMFTPRRRKRAANEPFRIMSSGRLVEKKGFAVVIEACRLLSERGENFECVIGGSGPLESDLRQHVREAKLEDVVTITGEPLAQERIPEFMERGDLYCLPCVWASDNDVDGLPQMLMEAMACGLPAVSTRLVGIPDLVIDGKTGRLVEPNDAERLANVLAELMHDEAQCERLAVAGRRWIEETFDIRTCLEPLIGRFRSALGERVVEPDVNRAPTSSINEPVEAEGAAQ